MIQAANAQEMAFATPVEGFRDFADLDLEVLLNPKIVGASKFEQPQRRAPASVDIISREDIKRYGYRTLADAIKSVRGMYATYDRNYTYIATRGVGRPNDYNTRLLVLVNGHRVNDNIFDSVLAGQDFAIDLNQVERIEVIRGPSSSLYGTNAFFGIINVVTRDGASMDNAKLLASVGSERTLQAFAGYGKRYDSDLDVALSLGAFQSRGESKLYFAEFDDPSSNNGIAKNMDDETAYRGYSSLKYKGLSIFASYSHREKDNPTAAYATIFNDPAYRSLDRRALLDASYTYAVSEVIEVFARSGYDFYHYRGDYPYDYPPRTINRDDTRGDWWTNEVRATILAIKRNRLTLGGEFKWDVRQDYDNFDVDPRYDYYNLAASAWSLGLYVQDEMEVLPWLVLNLGLRYDEYQDFAGAINPRSGIILLPHDLTTIKLLYGQAYRNPSMWQETFGYPLQAERITSLELAWEQRFADYFRFSWSGYRNRLRDLMNTEVLEDPDGLVESGDEIYGFRNSERVDTWGSESETSGAGPAATKRAPATIISTAAAIRANSSFPTRRRTLCALTAHCPCRHRTSAPSTTCCWRWKRSTCRRVNC